MEALEKESIAWAALEAIAKKRAQRDKLRPNSIASIRFDIVGTINGRSRFSATVEGALNVGGESTVTTSSSADANWVIALLLSNLDEAKRQRLMLKIAEAFEHTRALPAVDPKAIEDVKEWMKRLRSTTQTQRLGAISFTLADPNQ